MLAKKAKNVHAEQSQEHLFANKAEYTKKRGL